MKKYIVRKFLLTSRKKIVFHSFVSAASFVTTIKWFVSQHKALLESSIVFAFLLIILIACYLENTVLKLQHLLFSTVYFEGLRFFLYRYLWNFQ